MPDRKNLEILAQSEHYFIKKEYEDTFLYRKSDNKIIACIGDFYGEAEDAYIDPQERFCITVGCGIIKYYIKTPFEFYSYNRKTPQWIEAGREGNIEWCDRIEEVNDSFLVVSCNGTDRRRFNIDTLEK